MSPQQIVDHFGSIANAARALGVAGPSVSGWIANGKVPIDRQCQAEVVTHGQLIADRLELGLVTVEERRSGKDRRTA